MATEKQVQANQKNAQKSTGPRTPEGKAKSSQNAVTHGLTSKRPVLDIEDNAEFGTFVNELLDQLDPTNPLEFFFAKRAACQAWRIQRAQCYETLILNNLIKSASQNENLQARSVSDGIDSSLPVQPISPDSLLGQILADDFRNHRTLEKITRYEMRLENSMMRCLNQFQKIRESKMMNFTSLRHYFRGWERRPQDFQDDPKVTEASSVGASSENADAQNKANSTQSDLCGDKASNDPVLSRSIEPDSVRQNKANFAPDMLTQMMNKKLRDQQFAKKAM
jgi:hypothetical protein